MSQNHFIILGRTSAAVAEAIVDQFGRPNVIQSRFGTFKDGEANWELFLEDPTTDHPIHEDLTQDDKELKLRRLQNAHVTIVHTISGVNASSRAMSLLQAVDDLKKNLGVASITVIAPHTAYTRQDRKFTKVQAGADGQYEESPQHNAVANETFAGLLRMAGADRFVGLDFHSRAAEDQYRAAFTRDLPTVTAIHTLTRAFSEASAPGLQTRERERLLQLLAKIEADSLPNPIFGDNAVEFMSATGIVVPYLHTEFADTRFGFISPDGADKPDDLGVRRAQDMCFAYYPDMDPETPLRENKYMGGIVKRRLSPTQTVINKRRSFIGRMRKSRVVPFVSDDIAASGSTQVGACKYLVERGLATPFAYATHGVLPNGALRRIVDEPDVAQFITTDSVPSVVEKSRGLPANRRKKHRIITVAPLIVDAIRRDHEELQQGLTWQPVQRTLY